MPQVASSGDASIVMGAGEEAKMRELVLALAKAQQKALEDSTWVGRDFAEQARAMHYGEQDRASRSEEHTSALQSLMRISYAVFCLKKKTSNNTTLRD